MRKVAFTTLLLLLALRISAHVLYDETVDFLRVTSKYVQVEIDKNGNLAWVYHIMGRKTPFYKYDGDGLDVSIIAPNRDTELSPSTPTYTVNYGPKRKDGSFESVEITFVYPEGVRKTYRFDQRFLTYLFTLSVESEHGDQLKVALPLVWYKDTAISVGNFFLSYRPDTDFMTLVTFDGSLKAGSVVGSKLNFEIFMGPYKRTMVKHLYGERSGTVFTMLRAVPGVGTWYSFIADGLSEFFNWLYLVSRNFGLAIILFTIVVRLVLYPFYHAQTKQMIQMRKLQPMVDAIKKKYKEPQKQQEELMKLYKENKINPSSGCLMLLVQLPIFMLLYGVIQSYQELFSVSGGFLIWRDLSAGGWSENWLFLLLTIATSYYLALITSQDSRSAWQQIIMGAVFPFFFVGLPSGIFLYWTMNSIIQLAITFYIYKRYKIRGITNYELWGISPRRK